MADERRYKLVAILAPMVAECLFTSGDLRRIKIDGLPDGFKVEGVQYDYPNHCFTFHVSHPSFDPVPDGQCPPLVPTTYHILRESPEKRKCGYEFL